MRFTTTASDAVVLGELGRRIRDLRLSRNLTQARLAAEAGVSKRTVERLEDGGSAQLDTLVRCLRVLGRIEALDALVPDLPPNPLTLLERRGQRRRRASPTVGVGEAAKPWTWGDET